MTLEQQYADFMARLSREYYEKTLSKEAYRAKRKLLLDYMEDDLNGDFSVARSVDTVQTSLGDGNRS